MSKLFTAISTVIASMLFFIVSITSLYAKGITYSGSVPVITGSANDAAINNAIQNMFSEMLNNAQSNLSNIGNMPILLKSMASANTYVSSTATQINYHGYDSFAITLGFSVAGVGHDSISENKIINGNGDTKAGWAIQPWAVQIGLNAGFLLDGLYFAGKLGKTKDSLTYGILANYELIKELLIKKLPHFESLSWRGFRLGSGIIYQQNKINDTFNTSIQYSSTTVDDHTLRMLMKPNFLMQINSNAIVIPIEISTAIAMNISTDELMAVNEVSSVLACVISAGAGVDVNYGSVEFDVKSKSLFMVEVNETPLGTTVNPGKINVHANIKKQRPYYLAPKIMLGMSYKMGNFVIDFPFSFYFPNYGVNFGMTIGLAF
jgi:hypothetical protein